MVAQLDIRYHWILCYPLFYEDWKLHHCKHFNLITDRRWTDSAPAGYKVIKHKKNLFSTTILPADMYFVFFAGSTGSAFLLCPQPRGKCHLSYFEDS